MKLPAKTKIFSWGYGYSADVFLLKPNSIDEIVEILHFAHQTQTQVICKGGANSFGNVFLLQNQIVLDLTAFSAIKKFDATRGVVVVEGNALIREILTLIMPSGWFLHGVSGSIDNTVGGAIAANVHGKDSWAKGNFGSTIVAMKLLTPKGEIIDLSESQNSPIFYAVIGGLGLLGIILEVTFRLHPIQSLTVEQIQYKASNVNEIEHLLYPDADEEPEFMFSWIDGFASKKYCGRGIVERARFTIHENHGMQEAFRESMRPKDKVGLLPPQMFWSIFKPIWRRPLLYVFNECKYNFTQDRVQQMVPYPIFNFPWAKMPGANYSFYPHGFREIQALFCRADANKAFTAILALCKREQHVPILCSIKRHKSDVGYLTFAGEGMSISINLLCNQFKGKELNDFIALLLDVIMKYSGRIYLSKFSELAPDMFHAMYPEAGQYSKIKKSLDPNAIFWSDTAENLFRK